MDGLLITAKRRLSWIVLVAALVLGAGGVDAQQSSRKTFGDSLSHYHAERSRTYHLQSFVLRLTLDERQKSVSGTSTLLLRPLGPGLDTIEVDSADLQIRSVTQGDGTSLPFDRADEKLRIHVPAAAGPNEVITVTIAYSGTPRKGLYFVAPDQAYPDKPVQIWSQGEAEDSHFWFPVYDYPNDKATSEGYYTVNADYMVISNGRLVGVEEHPASHTKTYHWKQDVPHSTYLTSVVVGKFETYTEFLGQLPVEYFVPPGTGRDKALRSFHETPNAIRFFAEKIGIPYPYSKYSQVAVHDFVFGGMENISATTLTDRTLHDENSEPEADSVDLVTHELAHQWFGDLLTCSDWSHIWLNEGFATFFADLYREHRFGQQEYLYSVSQEQSRYLEEDRQRYRRPLVTYWYTDPLDLFDRTTYERGAVVLDMLRFVLGDDRFFAGIHHYALTHQQGNVVTDDLRKAFEESSGEDLGWFFEEWVYKAGYPELEITQQWDDATHRLHLVVEQKQTVDDNTPLFRMPADVEFTTPAGRIRRRIEFSHARDDFYFPLDREPLMTRFDPEHHILDTVKFPKPVAELIYQVRNDPAAPGRIWATNQLAREARGCPPDNGQEADSDDRRGDGGSQEPCGSTNAGRSPAATADIVSALRQVLVGDSFWGVKKAVAAALARIKTDSSQEALSAGLRDPDPRVRQAAVRGLGSFVKDAKAAESASQTYQNDPNPYVAAEAALAVGRIQAKGARQFLEKAVGRNSDHDVIRRNALRGLGELGDKKEWEIVARWLPYGRPSETRMAAVDALLKLGKDQDERTAAKLIPLLNDSDLFLKQRVMSALGEGHFEQARPALMKAAASEGDSRLRRSARMALERLGVDAAARPNSSKGKTNLQSPGQILPVDRPAQVLAVASR